MFKNVLFLVVLEAGGLLDLSLINLATQHQAPPPGISHPAKIMADLTRAFWQSNPDPLEVEVCMCEIKCVAKSVVII